MKTTNLYIPFQEAIKKSDLINELLKIQGVNLICSPTQLPKNLFHKSIFKDLAHKTGLFTFLSAVTGTIFGFAIQFHLSSIAYSKNLDGKLFISFPSFYPVVLQFTIFFAVLGFIIGFILRKEKTNYNLNADSDHLVFNINGNKIETAEKLLADFKINPYIFEKGIN